ncbi:class I SAM-dependent methyltransferase [Actinomycetospora cinnamomea]|uniref:Ubiquinone/menaquinone biosynthesis C-methylase UbiE n=1 Tax=Actinomycetospora cinnamomea TaxID=663609 RepID=A0A2U1EZK3_9PSEU|nr:class I SAM-dependent methyltransferase [Actinomycetospora cinnamomea]PVZ05341.1 ubiquinone/menaquinone biosynthesis C-methylase UbiE [Actinomycetospora cinnamomea]
MTLTTSDQVRTAWDTIAPHFDEFITPINIDPAEELVERLDVGPGTRLLDVACGSGALAIPAARHGAQVTAVDISPRMIELLDARARGEGLRIDGRTMDAHALDLPDDEFDVATSQNGVTMSPRLAVALREMVRVTRPGGRVLLAAFGPLPRVEFLSTFIAGLRAVAPDAVVPPLDPPPPPFQLADPDTFARALTAAGLQHVAIDRSTWALPVRSASDLWNKVTSSNPLGAAMVAGLDEARRVRLLEVLDGVLRERFGGSSAGTLHAAINVGVGTV